MSFKLTVDTPAFVPDKLLGRDMKELEMLSSKLNNLEEIASDQKELLQLAMDPELARSKAEWRRRLGRHAQRTEALAYTNALIKVARSTCKRLVNSIKKRSAERAHERARIKRHFC